MFEDIYSLVLKSLNLNDGLFIIADERISDNKLYKLTKKFEILMYDELLGDWINNNDSIVTVENILSGKLPIRPKELFTKNDFITLSYLKLAGYKFITKDSNGSIYASNIKPHKNSSDWGIDEKLYPGVIKWLRVEYDLSMISWYDTEPTVIDDLLYNCKYSI